VVVPGILAAIAVLVVLLLAGPAIWRVNEEIWVYAGLALVRAVGAGVAFVFTVGAAFLGYQWLENTDLGQRLQGNRELLFLGFLVAAALVFQKVVL
jgi:uncharacterized membrane protein